MNKKNWYHNFKIVSTWIFKQSMQFICKLMNRLNEWKTDYCRMISSQLNDHTCWNVRRLQIFKYKKNKQKESISVREIENSYENSKKILFLRLFSSSLHFVHLVKKKKGTKEDKMQEAQENRNQKFLITEKSQSSKPNLLTLKQITLKGSQQDLAIPPFSPIQFPCMRIQIFNCQIIY